MGFIRIGLKQEKNSDWNVFYHGTVIHSIKGIVENGYKVASERLAMSVIHYLTYDERLQLLHDPSLGPIRCGISLVILLLGRRAVPPPSKYARL